MLSPRSDAFISTVLPSISHLLHRRSRKNSILHHVQGLQTFYPQLSPWAVLPSSLHCSWVYLPASSQDPTLTHTDPTMVLSIAPGIQNTLWHHHSPHNYFKPASPSGKAYEYIYSAMKASILSEFADNVQRAVLEAKSTASPWVPTSCLMCPDYTPGEPRLKSNHSFHVPTYWQLSNTHCFCVD